MFMFYENVDVILFGFVSFGLCVTVIHTLIQFGSGIAFSLFSSPPEIEF
jgi:hypothetical protein